MDDDFGGEKIGRAIGRPREQIEGDFLRRESLRLPIYILVMTLLAVVIFGFCIWLVTL